MISSYKENDQMTNFVIKLAVNIRGIWLLNIKVNRDAQNYKSFSKLQIRLQVAFTKRTLN